MDLNLQPKPDMPFCSLYINNTLFRFYRVNAAPVFMSKRASRFDDLTLDLIKLDRYPNDFLLYVRPNDVELSML